MQPLLQKISILLACVSVPISSVQSFADLPTGTYRYSTPDNERLIRKSGSVVIGIEVMSDRDGVSEAMPERAIAFQGNRNSPVLNCFRGQAQGDRLIHTTQVSPPYSPASDWQSNQVIAIEPAAVRLATDDLAPTATEQSALEECIQAFWR